MNSAEELTHDRNPEDAKKCSDGRVRVGGLGLGLVLPDASISGDDILFQILRDIR